MSDTKIDLSLFFDEKPEEKENNNETKVKDTRAKASVWAKPQGK